MRRDLESCGLGDDVALFLEEGRIVGDGCLTIEEPFDKSDLADGLYIGKIPFFSFWSG